MVCTLRWRPLPFEWLQMQKLLYARLEAAQALSISLRKIDDLISTKSLKTVRVGKRNMVTRAELERFARNGTRKNR
jgi:excisionase family DNA binding protein